MDPSSPCPPRPSRGCAAREGRAARALGALFPGILLSPYIRAVGIDEGPGGPLRGHPSPRHGRVGAPDARQAVGRGLVGRGLGRLVRGRGVPLLRRRDLAAALLLAWRGGRPVPVGRSPRRPPPGGPRRTPGTPATDPGAAVVVLLASTPKVIQNQSS